jgi:C1A family cysteine protease
MKHKMQRMLALLLTVTMILCLFPVTVLGVESRGQEEEPKPSERSNGFLPVTHPAGRAVTDAYLSGDRATYERFTGGGNKDPLPSKYDSRDYNIVTSVKNQNPYGSCWSHAAMASIESYMIKNHIPVGNGTAATTSLNLSESQHCWFNYTYAYDAEGMLTGDRSIPDDPCLDQGGNGEMSAYTLMRWEGAADETQDALHYSNAAAVNYSGLGSQYAYQYNVCHVQNSEWIPGTNVEAVKRAIMEYGAGNISYYEDDNYNSYICNIDNTSQESENHKWANHSITVVGWDDSISASKFSPNRPSSPGAWICKNSWGTNYFDGGYCYISYEDTSMSEGYIYFFDAESIDNYQHNYQYDGTCNLASYGKGWSESIGYFEPMANNTKVANVFTANGFESLKAVSFCSWDEGLSYTVEIYRNPTEGNPSSGTLVATKSGTIAFCGYYTIPLDTSVQLSAGDTFSVVITQNVANGSSGIHTPYDASFNNEDVVYWCAWTHADHGATSFYKEPGGAWTDCPDNGDYRIKAYTDDSHFNVSAVSNNTAWGTVTVEGNVIHATPAAGYYVADYEVISGSATAVIDVNTITVTPQSDCTIRVIFAAKPTCTVQFMASGTLEGSQSALLYNQITLPNSVSVDPEGWTFSGWTETRIPSQTTDEPVFYAPGAAYTVMGNTTLYAVFTKTEGSANSAYELVTAAPVDWSGKYVITGPGKNNLVVFKGIDGEQQIENNDAPVSANINNTGITQDGSVLRNVADDYVFTLAKRGNYYTIKSPTNYWIGSRDGWLYNLSNCEASFADWKVSYDSTNSCMNISNVACNDYIYLVVDGYDQFCLSNAYTSRKTQLWKETSESVIIYWTEPIAGTHVHTPEYVPAQAPTCVDAGNTAYYYCTGCGLYFSDQACQHEITLESTLIPATGVHSYGGWSSNNDGTHKRSCSVCGNVETANCSYNSAVTEPTCTEAGYTTYTCMVCSYSYQGDSVPALGHSFGDWAVTAQPTCTEAGVKTRTCTRCSETETQSVDPLGHDYSAVVTEPTCTEEGYTTHTCSRCGDSYTDSAVNPLGHNWDEGVVTLEPTENEDGERLYTCLRCGATRTEVIPRLNQTNPFVDVAEGKYYYDAVLWAYYHDPRITSGTDATHFSPNAPCTREQIVFFLWAAAGKPAPEGNGVPFTDVKAGKYYYEAVLWAREQGITNGISESLFGVGKYCTREQIVTFLWRNAGSPEPAETENPFQDVSANAYYATAVRWAVELGVTGGTGPNTFSPKKLCTRAEVVTFLYKACAE